MHIVNGVLTKSAFCAVRVLTVFFGAGLIATAFAGSPGDSKKEVQAVQPALCDPPWYISLGLGLDIDTGVNSFVNGTTFSPFGGAGRSLYTEDLKGRSYNDVYDNSIYRIQAEVGYVLTNHVELFGTFKYAGGYGKKQYGDRDIYANFTTYSLVSYPGLYRSYGASLVCVTFSFPKKCRNLGASVPISPSRAGRHTWITSVTSSTSLAMAFIPTPPLSKEGYITTVGLEPVNSWLVRRCHFLVTGQ